jgi:hypothetical protein
MLSAGHVARYVGAVLPTGKKRKTNAVAPCHGEHPTIVHHGHECDDAYGQRRSTQRWESVL